jgi:hypothetical protein
MGKARNKELGYEAIAVNTSSPPQRYDMSREEVHLFGL